MNVRIEVRTTTQMKKFIEQLFAEYNAVPCSDYNRKYWRMPFVTNGYVQRLEVSGSDPVPITVQNISEDGIGFVTKQRIVPLEKVRIILEVPEGDVEFLGTVIHCTQTVGMYKIGVKYDLISPEEN